MVPYNLDIVAIGASGKVGEARWIAVERSETREGGACVYQSFTLTRKFVDVTLDVYEARTGKKVTSKKFEGPYVDCPLVASNKDSLSWRLEFAKVSEWVEGRVKSGWK